MEKKNHYYYSDVHNLFVLKQEGEISNQALKKKGNRSLKSEFSGKLDGDRIRYEFANTRQLLFEVTDLCNLECKYCAYGEYYCNYNIRKKQKLSLIKVKNLIDYYITFKNSAFYQSFNKSLAVGFYGGEPLLNYKLIKETIDYLENVMPGCHYNMTTNGTLLDKHLDYLVHKNFNLLISLDGNEKNNGYRLYKNKSSSFKDIFRNIKIIQEKYPDYFKSNVFFNSVLHNRNSVSEIFNFINKEFDKVPKIAELSPIGVRDDLKKDFMQKHQNLTKSLNKSENCSELIESLDIEAPERRALTNFLFDFSGNVFKNYNELFVDQNKVPKVPTKTCAPFARKIYLTVTGKIYPCERIGHLLEFGRVTDTKVLIDFNKIAIRQNQLYEKLKKQCLKCGLLRICNKCLLGLVNNNIPICDSYTKDKEALGRYYASHLSTLENHPHLYDHIWRKITLE